ncbi:hypothetical protein QAD02_008592 [Eretmocerus hayati]|uniref:Uncharacterized protein n=1 Tax=Eretmocerus hayati TaxID=131215 RepID=A0ACC2NBC8_9HYME|nr:hypothetical protein QAD02_008592 [Eretmocerus hayati]
MAQKILIDLLNSKLTSREVIDWLISNDSSDVEWSNLNNQCSKEEFVTFFLDSLRDQLHWVSQANIPQSTTASTLAISKTRGSCNKGESNNKPGSTKRSLIGGEKQLTVQINYFQAHCDSESLATHGQERSVLNIPSTTSLNVSSSVSKSSTIKERNPPKKRVELTRCSPSQVQNFNPAFKDSSEYEQLNYSDINEISFDTSSFPSLGNNSSSNVCNTSCSPDQTVSSLNGSKCSQISNVASCPVPQSPVSPLYSNSLSALSPIHAGITQNKIESPRSHNYSHLNNTSTPERSSRNTSRLSKSTPRQNLSLGDFIVLEPKNLKKNGGRKNCKVLSRSEEQNDMSDHSKLSDTHSQPKPNSRTRKVNPTRLIADDKGNKENAVFGSISRPFTQNPQFVDVPTIDKSVNNASFEIERGLIKIERQKKTETGVSESIDEDDSKNQPRLKHPLTPSKTTRMIPIVIPDMKLVKRVGMLNKLVEVYCGLLEQNLVMNPMTEMYAVISLLTTQYVNNDEEKVSDTGEDTNSVTTSKAELDQDRDMIKRSSSNLRRLLNFEDEAKIDIIDIDSTNSGSQFNESIDNPTDLRVVDGKTLELNQISNDVEKISLSEKCAKFSKNFSESRSNEPVSKTENCFKVCLNSPHNCVYFSSQVLNQQKDFLKNLDKVTLRLLSKNNLMAKFQPELIEYLDRIYETKVIQTSKRKAPIDVGATELSVCFQIDTDNKENFPTSNAFLCFKKQRDMFYDILKFWEDKHLDPAFPLHASLSSKIKTIFTVHTDVTNLTHFVRLFKSQMLISCIQMKQQEDVLDDETADFLKNLKDINPEKLAQLTKKLVTPSSQNGPVPLPSFPGIQEFFKDFIFCASNHMFYTYLKDTLICEIMELNSSQFTGSDIEDIGTEVDECTKESFITCISSLKLLSKFLGFVTSLPYRSETSMLEEVISSQLALRSKCLPPLDLLQCLQSAVVQGKLLLAIPWIVEYLAMMDHASLRLPCHAKVLKILYCIYRAANSRVAIDSEILFTETGSFLIRLTIGWLFQLPNFPVHLYHTWQSRYDAEILRIFSETQPSHEMSHHELIDADTSVVSIKHSLSLDKLDIIDDRVLYSCCPFLKELNILLTHGNPSVNNTSYRHVTPVTSQLKKPIKNASTRHLELQLEEAFFHGQPTSTRKTVEYVSERVASSCVKYIYNNLLPVEKKTACEVLKNLVEKYCEDPEHDKSQLKDALSDEIKSLSVKAAANVKEKSKEIVPNMCKSRVDQAMESLLAEDCLEAVKAVCKEISMRTALERITQWIQSHIVGGTLFVKDLELEINKNNSNKEIIVDKKFHNPAAPSPTSILAEFRKYMWDLMETRGSALTSEYLSTFCDHLYQSLTQRSDLKRLPEKSILSLSVDLCLFLITYRYDLFTSDVQSKVFRVWKIDRLELSDPDSSLSRILCARNIKLMAQSADENVWINCGKFLGRLLKEDILTIDSLSSQAVALFRNEWPVHISKYLSRCLSEAIDGFQSSDEETERIRYLLGWVAGACNDMDQDGFNFC